MASAVVISDANSVADIDGANVASWEVNGAEQLGAAGIINYYRVGSTGPAIPINSLSSSIGAVPILDFAVEQLFESTADGFNILFTAETFGGIPSKLPFQIVASKGQRLSGQAGNLDLDLHIFSLIDADVASTLGDSSLNFGGGGQTVTQIDNDANVQYFGNNSTTFGPGGSFPTAWQSGTGADLQSLLTGPDFTSLSNGDSNFSPGNDGAFALQFSVNLDGIASDRTDDQFVVSIQNNISPGGEVIPEPITGVLGMLSLSALGWAVTRRRI